MDKNITAQLLNPWKCRLFFFRKLPGAWFFRLKLTVLDEKKSSVEIPFTWATQNPFQSIYFAALAAAAELSTGAAVMAVSYGKNVSMLVTKMEGEFYKKSKGKITFTCADVPIIIQAVDEALQKQEGIRFTASTAGIDQAGVEVAKFRFEWSVKQKSA